MRNIPKLAQIFATIFAFRLFLALFSNSNVNSNTSEPRIAPKYSNLSAKISRENLTQLRKGLKFEPGPYPHTIVCNIENLFQTREITNEHTHKFLLQVPKCPDELLLVALVIIGPHFFEKRHIIRQTWAHSSFQDLRVFFVMGLSAREDVNERIRKESATYGDIIQEDYIDSYFKLTVKVMGAFKWVREFCPNVEFVLRINDHVIVNTMNLIKYLKNTFEQVKMRTKYEKYVNTIWGDLLNNSIPTRNKTHRHYIPEEEYGAEALLPYIEGTVVLMTADLAKNMFELSRFVNWPRFSVSMEVNLQS
jgi:hypothetical protein